MQWARTSWNCVGDSQPWKKLRRLWFAGMLDKTSRSIPVSRVGRATTSGRSLPSDRPQARPVGPARWQAPRAHVELLHVGTARSFEKSSGARLRPLSSLRDPPRPAPPQTSPAVLSDGGPRRGSAESGVRAFVTLCPAPGEPLRPVPNGIWTTGGATPADFPV